MDIDDPCFLQFIAAWVPDVFGRGADGAFDEIGGNVFCCHGFCHFVAEVPVYCGTFDDADVGVMKSKACGFGEVFLCSAQKGNAARAGTFPGGLGG